MSLISMVFLSLLWTGMLAGVAELLTRKGGRPHFAQMVWRGAAALMVLPWLASGAALLWPSAVSALPIPDMPDLGAMALGDASGAVEPAADMNTARFTLGQFVLAGLVIGWAVRLAFVCIGQMRLQLLKRAAEQGSERDGQGRDIILSPALTTAFAAGLRGRKIYLPSAITSDTDRRLIIAHEQVHIARGDLVTRPFERGVADLLWFSPFAWLARRRLDHLRELVCDAETLRRTGAGPAYARALVNAARLAGPRRRTLPVAALIPTNEKSLPMRVSAILNRTEAPARSRGGLVAALAGLLAMPLAVAQGVAVQAETATATYSHAIVDKGRITSQFGNRKDPFTGEQKWHMGTDIAGKAGSKIYAPAKSQVIFSGFKDGYGNVIDLQVTPQVQLRFGQLQEASVTVGQTVQAGDVIGLMGQSGRATGVHLHFEVWKQNGDGIMAHWDPEAEDITLIADCECKDKRK